MTALSLGSMAVPAGFELRMQATLRAKGEGAASEVAPRPHIVVSQGAVVAGETTAGALARCVAELKASSPSGVELDRGTFTFDDGVAGVRVRLQLEARPGLPVVQEHVFRLDGANMSHLTATTVAAEQSALDGDLGAVLRSFQPAGD